MGFDVNHEPGPLARFFLPAFIAAMLTCLPSCSLIKTTVDLPFRMVKAVLPGGRETEPVDPVALQEDMLRFADNLVASVSVAVEKLQKDGQPIQRAELLRIKLSLTTDVYGLATGSNALANMVGLTVLASVARSRVEDYWMPKVYGNSAEPTLNALRLREQEIWALANRVLKPDMQTELRTAIDKWRKKSAMTTGTLQAFASISLVNEVTKSSQNERNRFLPSSVFALLDMNPLAGLDPATRELAETRLFAERALFLGQRMPRLIGWQMELFAMHATSTPEVKEMVSSTTQIASVSDRLTRTVEQLPAQISAEREKLVSALKSEKQGLGELSRNFSQTFTEGGKMADATGKTLQTFQGILTQLEKQPSDPNEKPFDIKEYAATAVEINRMSLRLTELLKTLQVTLDPANMAKLSAEADELTLKTQQRSQAVVDYAFQKGLLLVALTAFIVLASGLLFQWLSAKIRTARS